MRGGRSIGVRSRTGRRPPGSGATRSEKGMTVGEPGGRTLQSSTRVEVGSVELAGISGVGEQTPPAQGDRRRGCWGSPESGASRRGLGSRTTR